LERAIEKPAQRGLLDHPGIRVVATQTLVPRRQCVESAGRRIVGPSPFIVFHQSPNDVPADETHPTAHRAHLVFHRVHDRVIISGA
jgi:DNA polymerase III alpha subunit (gram-positive type)